MNELDTISIRGKPKRLEAAKMYFFISVIKNLRLFKTDVLILVGQPSVS